MQSGEYIKTYCEQANRQNFHVWNSYRQHAHGYSRQCGTIGYLSNSIAGSFATFYVFRVYKGTAPFVKGDSCTACYKQTFGSSSTPGYKCVNDLCGTLVTIVLINFYII